MFLELVWLSVFITEIELNQINMMNKEEETTPVLLFLLNHNRFNQFIKAILNSKMSQSLLEEYGLPVHGFTQVEEFRIARSVQRFNILQLIELKGSNTHSVKEYQNIVLQEMIRRKLSKQHLNNETRKYLWLQFTELYIKPNFYCQLKRLEIGQDFVTIIEKDILRTYNGESVRADARQVLQIFSHYNPYIGYCQGMNTIIAFLISRGFNCEQSFFIFKKVTQVILPCDYYSNMENMMVYTRIFYEMLAFTHPQVYLHMKKIATEMESTYAMMVSFVLQWFVCLFCNDNVCQQITEVIWDLFLVDGIVVLFKAALGYIDILKPFILQCPDFEAYNNMQKQQIKLIKDTTRIKKRIMETFICPSLLFLLKQKLMQPNEDNEKNTERKQSISFKKNCHRRLNVCFQALQDNLQEKKPFDIFVFRPNCQINIIPNYMDNINRHYFHNQKQKSQVDKLIIGRIPHVCRYSSDTLTEGSLSDKNLYEEEIQKTPKKSTQSTPKQIKTPSKQSEKKIREKVCQRIAEMAEKKKGIGRSESVIFMQEMVKNASISNLLELYDIDQLFQ